jgi:hypothetical protein
MADIRPTNTGPGRVLLSVYGLFAVAATSRAAVQLSTKFDEAPVAYTLSAVAGVIYIVATVALARSTPTSRRVALVSCSFELAGVLVVGTLSLIDRDLFPDETVWSVYGSGYGFVPLVLPVLGLIWLRRTARPEPLRDVAANGEEVAEHREQHGPPDENDTALPLIE